MRDNSENFHLNNTPHKVYVKKSYRRVLTAK